jgi:hypothetical protein
MNMKSFIGKAFPIAAAVVLVCGYAAQAADNQAPEAAKTVSRDEAQETIKAKKAEARQRVSEGLQEELTQLEKDWGIKLYGIRWTASGYMLEMKLRVLDPQKAFPLLKRDARRYLIVEKDGAVLEIPFTQKLGSLRSTVRSSNMVRDDTNYIALFANPGKHVKPGDKVTLVIGNFIAENIFVQ